VKRNRLIQEGYAMLNWQQHMIMQQERYQDLLREAHKGRLIKEARQAHASHLPLYCRALAQLGKRMVAWGTILQTRFEPSASDSALQLPHSP
jgi:hypothetical protein